MPRLNKRAAAQFKQALITYGLNESQVNMLMAQAAQETDGFNKKPALENNNFGGVKYNNSLRNIATPSSFLAPAKEDRHRRRIPYAHFEHISDFISKWIPYAHLNGMVNDNDIGAPLDATSMADFGHRLKLNHYYQDTELNYQNGLKRWDDIIQITLSDYSFEMGLALPYLPALEKNNWWYNIGLPESIVPKTARISIGLSDMPKNIPKGSLPYKADLPATTFGSLGTNNIANSKDSLLKHSKNKKKQIHKQRNELINELPKQKNIWAYSGFINNALPFASPSLLPNAAGLVSKVDSISDPIHTGSYHKKYSAPPSYRDNKSIKPTEIPIHKTPKPPSVSGTTYTPGEHGQEDSNGKNGSIENGKVINMNKPLVGNVTINVKDVREGILEFKHKIEEVLLEILNSANAI